MKNLKEMTDKEFMEKLKAAMRDKMEGGKEVSEELIEMVQELSERMSKKRERAFTGRKMEEVTVKTDGESIRITQPNPNAEIEEGDLIIISPDQVDTLCKWLKEARDEIKKQQ